MPTGLPTVSGTAANDVFAYENGGTVPLSYRGQRIEGGAGFDIVTYRHSRDECNVSSYDWGWLAEDIIPGIQAVDHLIDVERLQFSDGTLVIDTDDPAAQVYRLYNATLGRTPDSGGLKAHSENYIAQNWTLSQVAEGFIASTEFQNIYGPVDDGQFVTLLYRNVLGREPEPAGYENWVGAMRSGMGRTDVVVQFSESLEHIGLYSAAVPDGFWMA
jgi:serralysin